METNILPHLHLALAAVGASGVLFALSLAILAVALWLFLVSRRKSGAAAQPDSPGPASAAEAPVSKPELLAMQFPGSRSTLMKLATYQDAETLRDVAVRETAQMLGAVSAYLFRHGDDGTVPLAGSWFESKERDRFANDVALESESPDYLDSHAFIAYTRNQKKENNPKWDTLLGKAGANTFLAAPIRIDGEVWGHVSYISQMDAPPDAKALERLNEACAMVQIGVSRAKIIEKREEHQRQLAAAARAANRAAKAKTLFLATMSHEIRTPLNAIVGFSEFLNDPEVTPDEIREYTAGISQSADALLGLINDVLDLSKLESGKVDMSGHCDLPALFRELVNVFRYRARAKSISIESRISPEFPALSLSEDHMRQILLNLVGNAVKFTESGSVEFSAECRPDGNGTVALHITVKDTGCGIPPDRLRTIFEPFDDGETTRGGNAYGGTGLGLPIVKRLVESCNGSINVESSPGKGTEVYVRIGHVQLADAPAAGKVELAKPVEFPKDFSVLIVDDVPVNLKVLTLRVRKMGIGNVYSANSGEEALKILETTRPNVVLTDMWMPGMNGADLALAMRQTKTCGDVPVIAVTADSDARASFDMSNFSGMITKPVSVEKLRAGLAKVAGSRVAA